MKYLIIILLCVPLFASEADTLYNLADSAWHSIPNTLHADVQPGSPAGIFQGTGDGDAVIEAWGGGCYDSQREVFILWGGGHDDYYGNEIYGFNLDSLNWELITNPSTPCDPADCCDSMSDGTPNSVHSYSGLAYMTYEDLLFTYAGSKACQSGGSSKAEWVYDFDTDEWTFKDASGTQPTFDVLNVAMYYDEADTVTYMTWHSELYSYKYSTNAWTQLDNSQTTWACMGMTIDTKREILFAIGDGYVNTYDIGNDDYTLDTWTTTGETAIISGGDLGLDYDPVSDRLIAWDGGTDIYSLNLDTKVWSKTTVSGNPTITPNGMFNRFRYIPDYNVFICITDSDEDVYFYKHTAGAGVSPVANLELEIKNESASNFTNYPVQLGYAFIEGDIENYPQVIIDDLAITTQSNVKNRWDDGSVAYAVMYFYADILAGDSIAVQFQNSADSNSATYFNEDSMKLARFDFDAKMVFSDDFSDSASARIMLDAADFTYWCEGSVATSVIIADHDSTMTYDLGSDAYNSIRPIYHATFWHDIDKVKVRYVCEISNSEAIQDESYDLTLKINDSDSVVYTQYNITHYGGARWSREYWIGGVPEDSISYDYDLGYLKQTLFVWNYDTSKVVSESAIATQYAAWGSDSLFGEGNLEQYMPEPGGRPDIGPYPTWQTRLLYDGDFRNRISCFGNAELALAWGMHYREADTTKYLDRDSTTKALGFPVSAQDRPTLSFGSGLDHGETTAEDRIEEVGDITDGGWVGDLSHQPDMFSVPYILTGDYIWLEQMWFWSSWSACFDNGAATTSQWGRGPTGSEGGISYLEIRMQAWAFRSRVHTGFLTPDNHIIKTMHDSLISDAICQWEATHGISEEKPGSAQYSWAQTYQAFDIGANPLNFWADYFYGTQGSLDPNVTYGFSSTWETNFLVLALGRAENLGFPTDSLVTYLGENLYHQYHSSDYNPYLVEAYRIPTVEHTDSTWFDTWAEVYLGYTEETRGISEWTYPDAPEHGYQFISMAAVSFVKDSTAWEWAESNILPDSDLNDTPNWAILPRSLTFSSGDTVEVGKWQRHATKIEDTSKSDPFEEIFTMTWTHTDSGDSLVLYGYYAGADTFEVSFMPNQLGEWTGITTCGSDADLDGVTDVITCVASGLKGMLQADGKKWKFADGNYHIPMGFRSEVHFDTFSNTDFFTAMNQLADSVNGTVFNTRLTNQEGWYNSRNDYIFTGDGDYVNMTFDTTYFARTQLWLDSLTANNLGLYIMFYSDDAGVPGWSGQTATEEQVIRYVTARFSAYPIIIWDTGIDISEFRSEADIDTFGSWLAEYDAYDHPRSSRQGGGASTIVMDNQTYNSDASNTAKVSEILDAYNDFELPAGMNDCWGENRTSHPSKDHTPEDIKRAFWKCVVNGGTGGMIRPGRADSHNGYFIASEFLDDLESEQWLRYVNPFIEDTIGTDFGDMEPNTGVVSGVECYATANSDTTKIIYLLVGENDTYDDDVGGGGDVTFDLSGLDSTYTARWFNPRTGVFSNITGTPLAGGSSHVKTPPSTDDWVALLESIVEEAGSSPATPNLSGGGTGKITGGGTGSMKP